MLRDVALALALFVVLYHFGQMAAAIKGPAPVPAPLDFRLVEETHMIVRSGTTREEVERWLGPPTESSAWGAEIDEFEVRWYNMGRNPFPADRVWHRWSDPDDPDRWFAVVYTGRYPGQQVYGTLKKGF